MAETLGKRYDEYARKTDPGMLILAFVFLLVWSTSIIFRNDLPSSVRAVLLSVQGLIWLVFLIDIIIRTAIANRRWRFLLTHPLDIVAVALPAARPLKILAVFAQGTAFVTAKGRLKTMQAVLLSVILLLWLGAVSILQAERFAEGGQITSFGDALWWAIVTVTTVGYGDFAPVTVTGRVVAIVMMLLGIALIGYITASVAAWFVELTSSEDEEQDEEREEDRHEELRRRIVSLEEKIDRLLEVKDGAPKGD